MTRPSEVLEVTHGLICARVPIRGARCRRVTVTIQRVSHTPYRAQGNPAEVEKGTRASVLAGRSVSDLQI
jgi:hypothetical protein